MEVSVIIVTYNTVSMTNKCIESIIKYTSGISYEIILVDNASSDGSKEIFERDSRIKYVYSNINLGFGKANNLGVKYAAGKYVLFLNSDTILISNAIYELFKCISCNTKIEVIGAQLLWPDKSPQQSTFKFPKFFSILLESIGIKQQTIAYDNCDNSKIHILDGEFISGADLMMSTDTFKKIGGFDESFFMYYEETDLQLRLIRLGCKLAINPNVNIIHINGGSQNYTGYSISEIRKKYAAKLKILNDSRITYFKKNNPKSLLSIKLILTISTLLRIIKHRKYTGYLLKSIWLYA